MSFSGFEDTAFGHVRMDSVGWGYRLHARLGADGMGTLVRGAQGLFGWAALIAALGLWVLPGSSFELDLMAMKGAVSVGLLILAVFWLRQSRQVRNREVHVDLVRKEVRIMEADHLRQMYRFAELGAMYVKDHALYLHAPEGHTLAVLDLDPATEAQLA